MMLMRVPIAIGLGAVAVIGFGYLTDIDAALGILIDSPIRTVTNFNFSVVPMFIMMGVLVSAGGMSRELFRAANAWLGHYPGGMAMATVLACGGFAAINGSSVATAATMTHVALPEMRRVGYDPGLSAGVIAAGGTAAATSALQRTTCLHCPSRVLRVCQSLHVHCPRPPFASSSTRYGARFGSVREVTWNVRRSCGSGTTSRISLPFFCAPFAGRTRNRLAFSSQMKPALPAWRACACRRF
ncbi:MAG: TRAP transporter large permease subunit [Alphaproteobacteria bacterium]